MDPNSLSPSQQLAYSTVQIECTLVDDRTSTGTGFFFIIPNPETSNFPVVVTNKHVVKNAKAGKFILHAQNVKGPAKWVEPFRGEIPDGFEKAWAISNAAFQPPVRRDVRTICSDAIF